MTTLINLYAGSGCGKSTTAALVFARMKLAGISCELVTEYVKTWAWRGRAVSEFDDVYITGKQLQREAALYGKVDYIVTDSPIGLGAVYEKLYRPEGTHVMLDLCTQLIRRQQEAGVNVVNMLLKRNKPYVQAGRYENETAARRVDAICAEFLNQQTVLPFYVCTADDVLGAVGVKA